MEEKQLKGNVIEIDKSLRAKFDVENPKDNMGGADYQQEILMIHHKWGRTKCTTSVQSIMEIMQGLTFSTNDPSPAGWKGVHSGYHDPSGIRQPREFHRYHLRALLPTAARSMERRTETSRRPAHRIHRTEPVALKYNPLTIHTH